MLKSPTEKQIKYVDEIAYCLGIDFPRGSYDFNSYSYWLFIKEHIKEYNEFNELRFYDKLSCSTGLYFFDEGDWDSFTYDIGLWEY